MATDTRNPTSELAVSGTWTDASGTRWPKVDDYPDSGNPIADGITHGTATVGHIEFGFTPFAIPAGSVNISVQVLYYDFKNGTGSCSIRGELQSVSGAVQPVGSTHNPGNGNGNIAQRTDDTGTTNPFTGAAWTVDQVNGVGTASQSLGGFGLVSTDANPSITISSIQLQVTYSPPPKPSVSEALALTDVQSTNMLAQPQLSETALALTDVAAQILGRWVWDGVVDLFDEPQTPSDDVALTDTIDSVLLISANVRFVSTPAESIALAEGLLVDLFLQPVISDAVALTDDLQVFLFVEPQATDAIDLTDVPIVNELLAPAQPSPSESLALTETTLADLLLFPQVSDALALTDVTTMTGLTIPLTLSEDIALGEALLPDLFIQFAVSDAVALGDSSLANRVDEPHASDDLALTEGLAVFLFVQPMASESQSVDEALVNVSAVTQAGFGVSDHVALDEDDLGVNLLAQPHASDSIGLSDVPTVTGLVAIPIGSEAVAISETVLFYILVAPVAEDTPSITLTDVAQAQTGVILPARTASASDDLALTDLSLANVVDQPHASDSTTPADAVVTNLLAQPHGADSQTLTDILTLGLFLQPMLSESVTLIEDLPTTTRIFVFPRVSDAIVLSEDTPVANVLRQPHASEALTLDDTGLTLALFIFPLTSEAIVLTDVATVPGPLTFAIVADALTPADATPLANLVVMPATSESALILTDVIPQVHLFAEPMTSDSITLDDATAANLLGQPLGSEAVVLTDTVLVQRWLTQPDLVVDLLNQPHLLDSLTMTDTPAMAGLVRLISVEDSVTLTDLPSVPLSLWAPVTADALVLTDVTSITGLILAPTVAESLTLDDSGVLVGLITIWTPQPSESVTLAESLTVDALLFPRTSDSAASADVPQALVFEKTWRPTASEAVALTDAPLAQRWFIQPDLQVNLLAEPQGLESVALTDVPLLALVSTGFVYPQVSELVFLTDTPALSFVNVRVSDGLQLTDVPGAQLSGRIYTPAVSEAISLVDGRPRLTRQSTSLRQANLLDQVSVQELVEAERLGQVLDSIILTDVAVVALSITLKPATTDPITLSDGPSVFTNILVLAVADGVLLTDVPLLAFPIQPAEAITLTDVARVTGLRLIQTVSDSLTLADSLITVDVLAQPVVTEPALLMGDVPAAGLVSLVGILQPQTVDAFSLLDQIAPLFLNPVQPFVADVVSANDLAAANSTPVFVVSSETLAPTDQLPVVVLLLPVTVSEAVVLTDVPQAALVSVLPVTTSDGIVGLTDTGIALLVFSTLITEPVILVTEDTRLVVSYQALASEALTLTDVAQAEPLAIRPQSSDAVAPSDQPPLVIATTTAVQILFMPEGVVLTDTPLLTLFQSFWDVAVAEPAMDVFEGRVVSLTAAPIVQESLILTDTPAVSVPGGYVASESVALTDVPVVMVIAQPLASDALTLTDVAVVFRPVLTLQTADTIILTDISSGNLQRIFATAADALTLTDAVIVNALRQPHVTDAAGLTDTGAVQVFIQPQVDPDEEVAVGESVSVHLAHLKPIVADVFQLNETTARWFSLLLVNVFPETVFLDEATSAFRPDVFFIELLDIIELTEATEIFVQQPPVGPTLEITLTVATSREVVMFTESLIEVGASLL